MTSKDIIRELLAIASYKVENDECTEEDLIDLAEILSKELHMGASVSTISKLYGQSTNNVSNVISRNLIPKGARKNIILYDMSWFSKVMPSHWKKK